MYIFIPSFLLVLPATFFDEGQSISVFENLGIENYISEGLTRGAMHFIHFEFEEAWQYNKMIFIVLPVLSYLWAAGFLRDLKRYITQYFADNAFLMKIASKIPSRIAL